MPDIENAADLLNAVQHDVRSETVVSTVIVNEHGPTGQRRNGYDLLRTTRELIELRIDRDWPDESTAPPIDFELLESQTYFSQMKNAVNRAAERARFR